MFVLGVMNSGFGENRAYNIGIGPGGPNRRTEMAVKKDVLLTTRVLTWIRVAKEMARDEAAKDLLRKRSDRMDSVANRVLRRVDSDYFPGVFGPFLKDKNGKCAGQGEWTTWLKMVLLDAYLDEKALAIVETPLVPTPAVGFVSGPDYGNADYIEYLNEWAMKRVAERSLKASV